LTCGNPHPPHIAAISNRDTVGARLGFAAPCCYQLKAAAKLLLP
jgi:hypothetical protein